MPVLPAEPFLFPAELLDSASPAFIEPARWWVLHTRPRAEKSLARRLHAAQAPFFLPVFKRTARCRGQLVTSYLPLFPGYLFLFADDSIRLRAVQQNAVVSTLFVDDQLELRRDLESVYRLMQSDAPLTPEDRWTPGTPVEIRSGPLAGLEGRIVRRKKNLRFVVEVNFLQRGASVEIESWMLEPIETGCGRLVAV